MCWTLKGGWWRTSTTAFRYALIVYGVANTAAVLIATRSSLFVTTTPAAIVIRKILSAVYAVVAFATLAMRSAPSAPSSPSRRWPVFAPSPAVPVSDPSWSSYHPLRRAPCRRSWTRRGSMAAEDLSRELTIATLASKAASDRKHAALKRLYTGLSLMLLLGAMMIAALGPDPALSA